MTSASSLLRSQKGVNVALWGRDASDRVTALLTDAKYNSLYGLHQKFIVLDCEITNNAATVSTFELDGIRYSLTAGQIKSFSNHPWSEFLVVSAGAGGLDLAMDGILYDTLEELGIVNRSGGFNTWQ